VEEKAPAAAGAGAAGAGRVVLARRPILELGGPAGALAIQPEADSEAEEPSPLDVPTYLRRQEG
jgi:hypothetical protein